MRRRRRKVRRKARFDSILMPASWGESVTITVSEAVELSCSCGFSVADVDGEWALATMTDHYRFLHADPHLPKDARRV